MTPDPERENTVRERVQALLAAAPEPDAGRLAAGLQVARGAARRRRRARRTMAWLAVACLLGAGAATADWWLGSGVSKDTAPTDDEPRAVSREESDGAHGAGEDTGKGSGGTDHGLIYQGAE